MTYRQSPRDDEYRLAMDYDGPDHEYVTGPNLQERETRDIAWLCFWLAVFFVGGAVFAIVAMNLGGAS